MVARKFFPDLILLIGLVLSILKFTFGVDRVWDLGLYDETSYLGAGIQLLASGKLPTAQDGPLYSLWYACLALIYSDPIKLYYSNIVFVSILAAICFYLFQRVAGVSHSFAFLSSLYVSTLVVNSYAPRVGVFAVSILFLVWIAGARFRFRGRWLFFGTLACAFASLARPEFAIGTITSLMTLAIFTGYLWFFKGIRSHALGVCIATSLVVLAASLYFFGNPIGGNRSWVAFGQHFSLRWAAWTQMTQNPWTHWRMTMAEVFPGAESIGGAVLSNPAMFFKHVSLNVLSASYVFIRSAYVHFQLFPGPPTLHRMESIALIVALFGIFVRYRTRVLRSIDLRRASSEGAEMLTSVLLWLVPILLSIVLIFPQPRLMVLPCFLFGALVSWLLTRIVGPVKSPSPVFLAVIGVIVMPMVVPPWLSNDATVGPLRHRCRVEGLRKLPVVSGSKHINILESAGGYDVYLGARFRRVAEYDKNVGFSEFLKSRDIGMIIPDPVISVDVRFRNDAEYLSFVRNPEIFGFRLVDSSPCLQLYVREDLLAGQPQPS